jgi:four helix bundle protein
MAPRDHKELRCWQLANQLRGEVHDICESPAAAQDFKFCGSFRDAIGSVCRNLSEGFARGTPCEIAQYFRYALASLEETKDHLEECRIRTLLAAEKLDRLVDIAEHAKATAINFKKPHEERCRRQRRSRGNHRRRPGNSS